MPKVVVYVREEDWKKLAEQHEDPAKWVRDMVSKLLEKRRDRS